MEVAFVEKPKMTTGCWYFEEVKKLIAFYQSKATLNICQNEATLNICQKKATLNIARFSKQKHF